MATAEVKVLDFSRVKLAVAAQFEYMQKHPMFRVQVSGYELWDLYLKSFPPGTNPIFRERTEHDCACCRHFIRDIGNAVAIVDGRIETVWDTPTGDRAYDTVVRALAALVKSKPIADVFMHYERTAGVDKNHELIDGVSKPWHHFFVNVAPAMVAKRADIPTLLGEKRAQHDVLLRGLSEIRLDAIDQFIDLVGQGSLYRGEEHKGAVQRFRALKMEFDAINSLDERDRFVWVKSQSESPALSKIRNTVAGTLLVDLSEGVDIEVAVKSYETKVAPTNYKRPTALVTKKMIEQAKETIAGLGLTSALERRFAVIGDVTINNVLFADRRARKAISGDVFDDLASDVGDRAPKSLDSVEEVPIDRFLSEVLPRIDSLEVLLENRHGGNLVSLIAPADPTAGLLFKWPNKFSWSYAGELADSIKERVKKAGGNVSGDLCCRLAWHNFDDLDFHMTEPGGGHIYYATRHERSKCGGKLDVDMNAGHGTTREPVENIFYAKQETMREGTYTLRVNQFNNRDKTEPGYEVEIDWLGTVYTVASERSPRQGEYDTIAEMKYTRAKGLEFITPLKSTRASRQVWGLPTESFHRASVVMLSPNHWDGEAVGNKHHFFMLDGCANDGTARGFFNEFLMPALDKHRKVFEMVGSKLKLASASEQLSGLGFSSTQRNSLVCRVKGSFTRTIKIIF